MPHVFLAEGGRDNGTPATYFNREARTFGEKGSIASSHLFLNLFDSQEGMCKYAQ